MHHGIAHLLKERHLRCLQPKVLFVGKVSLCLCICCFTCHDVPLNELPAGHSCGMRSMLAFQEVPERARATETWQHLLHYYNQAQQRGADRWRHVGSHAGCGACISSTRSQAAGPENGIEEMALWSCGGLVCDAAFPSTWVCAGCGSRCERPGAARVQCALPAV